MRWYLWANLSGQTTVHTVYSNFTNAELSKIRNANSEGYTLSWESEDDVFSKILASFIYLLHFLDNPVYHFYQYAHIHLHETTAYTINSSLEQNTHKKSQFGIEVNYRDDNCLC